METIAQRSDSRSVFIAATPDQVFATMSDPVRLERWWGPDGFSNTIQQFEFRPGGTWLLTMHSPDGKDYANESRFTRLIPNEIFEIEHYTVHHFFLTITLQPSEQGTLVNWRQTFDTIEHYQGVANFVTDANEQNLQRLKIEVLSTIDPA